MSPTITIAGLEFPTPAARYAEGHTLSGNEASALNQLLLENLRNNFAPKVKAAQKQASETGVELDPASLDFSAYADAYVFGIRRESAGKATVDPVRAEAEKLAKSAIHQAIEKKGMKPSGFAKEKIAELVEGLLADEHKSHKIWTLAKERVAQKQALASADIGDMIGDAPEAPVESAPKPTRKGKRSAEAQPSA